ETLGRATMCLQLDLLRHRYPTFNRRDRKERKVVFLFSASSARSAVALSRGARRRRFGLPAAALRPPRQDGVHLIAFEPRHRLGERDVRQLLNQSLQDAAADFWMRHFAAAKEDRRLHFVAVVEEALDVLLLELIVVLVDLGAKLDLFDLDHLLVLARLARPLLLLVLILPEVHDAADRRHRRRRDPHQVETLLLRYSQGLGRGHDAELRAGVVNHADFPHANALVDSRTVVAPGTSVESDKASLQQQSAISSHSQLSAVSSDS